MALSPVAEFWNIDTWNRLAIARPAVRKRNRHFMLFLSAQGQGSFGKNWRRRRGKYQNCASWTTDLVEENDNYT
jgi:hypothetical protein